MKNSKAIFKKAIVGVLSLTILLASLLTAIPVSAQSALADDDGFYIPYANTDLFTMYTDADPNKPGVNTAYDDNGDRAGIHLTFNGGDFTKRVVSTEKYNIDDLSLRFDNLKKAEGHEDEDLKFSVMFASNNGNMPEFRLMFDTAAGTVSYFSGTVTPKLMVENDLLKYDSLSANEFVVSFDILTDSIECSVKVGDNEAVNGYITDTNYTSTIPANIASYIVLGPGRDGSYYFSIDVTGIKSDDYTRPTNAALEGGITNLNGLGTNIAIVNYISKFPQARTISFAAGKDVGARTTSAAKVTTDGISFRFDSLTASGTSYPQFTVCLMDDVKTGMPRIRVMIDTVDGTVRYWAAADAPAVVGQSDLLKYETLSKNEFTYTFNFLDSGDAKVTVNVGGTDAVSGILPNSYLTQYYKNITGSSQVYYCFAPGKDNNRSAFSVRFTGYRQTKELSFVDGDNTTTAIVTAGQKGIVTPKIALAEGEAYAYWMSGDVKYLAGDNASVYTASSDAKFVAIHRNYGDINDNGEVNGADLVSFKKYLLGVSGSYLLQAADINSDNLVSILDYIGAKKLLP